MQNRKINQAREGIYLLGLYGDRLPQVSDAATRHEMLERHWAVRRGRRVTGPVQPPSLGLRQKVRASWERAKGSGSSLPLRRARGRGYLTRRPLLSLCSILAQPSNLPGRCLAHAHPPGSSIQQSEQCDPLVLKWRQPSVLDSLFSPKGRSDPFARAPAHRALGGHTTHTISKRRRKTTKGNFHSLVNTLTVPSSNIRHPSRPQPCPRL